MSEEQPQSQSTELDATPTITCDAFWAMEERGDRPTLIDIRDQDAWDKGHIDWATHIPQAKIKDEAEQIIPEKNEEIVICCATGGESTKVAQDMIEMGYANVKSLSGGYTGYCGGLDNPSKPNLEENN